MLYLLKNTKWMVMTIDVFACLFLPFDKFVYLIFCFQIKKDTVHGLLNIRRYRKQNIKILEKLSTCNELTRSIDWFLCKGNTGT